MIIFSGLCQYAWKNVHGDEYIEGDYNTIAGLILHELSYIPRVEETINWKGFEFEIMDMDRPKIDKVLITRK